MSRDQPTQFAKSLSLRVDSQEGLTNVVNIGGANQAGDFLAIVQKNQRGPELDPEGTTQWLAFTVFHLEVLNARMCSESCGKQGLHRLTVRAPGRAKLEDGRASYGVDIGASRFNGGVSI